MSVPIVFESIANVCSNSHFPTSTSSLQGEIPLLGSNPQFCTFAYGEDQTQILIAKTTGNHICQITLLKQPQSISTDTSTHLLNSNLSSKRHDDSTSKLQNNSNGVKSKKRKRGDNPGILPSPSSPPLHWDQQYQKVISLPNKKSFSIVAIEFASSSYPIDSHNDSDYNEKKQEQKAPILFMMTKNGFLYYARIKKIVKSDNNDYNRTHNGDNDVEIEIVSCQRKFKNHPSKENRFLNDNFLLGMNLLSVKLDSSNRQGMYKPQNHLRTEMNNPMNCGDGGKYNGNSNSRQNDICHQQEQQQQIYNGRKKISRGTTMAVAGSSTLNPPMIIHIPPTPIPDIEQSKQVSPQTSINMVYTLDVPGLDHLTTPITSIQIIDECILDKQSWISLRLLWEHGHEDTKTSSRETRGRGGIGFGTGGSSTSSNSSMFLEHSLQQDLFCSDSSVVIMGFQDGSIFISFLSVAYEQHNSQQQQQVKSSRSSATSIMTPILNISHAHLIYRMEKPMQSIITTCLAPTSTKSCAEKYYDETNNINKNVCATTTTLLVVGSLGNIAVLIPPSSSDSSCSTSGTNIHQSNISTKKETNPSFNTISCSCPRSSSNNHETDMIGIRIIKSVSPLPPTFSNYVSERNTFANQQNGKISSLTLAIVSSDCSTYLVNINIQDQQSHYSSSSNDIVDLLQSSTYEHDYKSTFFRSNRSDRSTPIVTTATIKLPIRKEMKYVSSQWKISSSLSTTSSALSTHNPESLYLTFNTLQNKTIILVPKYDRSSRSDNCINSTLVSAKKSKLNVDVENGDDKRISDDDIINGMFDLLKRLSSEGEKSNKAAKSSQHKNNIKAINKEISESRRLLSIVSSISAHLPTHDDSTIGDEVNSLKPNPYTIDIVDPNVLSINIHPILNSHPCEEFIKNESLTVHAFENMPVDFSLKTTTISEQFQICGRRQNQNRDSTLHTTNIYYGGSAQSTSYAKLREMLKNSVDFYRWDNCPLQTFVSTFIPCGNSTYANHDFYQKSSVHNGIHRYTRKRVPKVTDLTSQAKSTINFHKSTTNDCDGICLHIPTHGFDCIDVLELLNSNQVESSTQPLSDISSTLILRLNDPDNYDRQSLPINREEKLIDHLKQQSSYRKDNHKTFITSALYSFMAPSFLKSSIFGKNENFVLGSAVSVNMVGASLVSDSKSDGAQCSAQFAVVGNGENDTESVLRLIEASLKKRLANFCHLNHHNTESRKLLDLYRNTLNDPLTKSSVSYMKKLLNKLSMKENPTPSEVMGFYKKLRSIKILIETRRSK